MPFRRPGGRRPAFWLPLILGLYALVLVGSPALHHDLACHMKSATHCDACTANPLASRIEVGLSLAESHLPPVGWVRAEGNLAPRPSLSSASSGRSPPR
jgi:hypothetical protein